MYIVVQNVGGVQEKVLLVGDDILQDAHVEAAALAAGGKEEDEVALYGAKDPGPDGIYTAELISGHEELLEIAEHLGITD